MPAFRSFFRMILAIGSMLVLLRSATLNIVGSNLFAAPMLLISGTPSPWQRMAMSIFAFIVSMQSAT